MTICAEVNPASTVEMLRARGTVVRALSSLSCATASVSCHVDHNEQAHASRSGVRRRSSEQEDEKRSDSILRLFFPHKTDNSSKPRNCICDKAKEQKKNARKQSIFSRR